MGNETNKSELTLRQSVDPEDYTDPNHRQFVEDMLDVGLEPYHYHGRWHYKGPAVDVDEISDAMAPTSVRCNWDGMGRGYVVYPK